MKRSLKPKAVVIHKSRTTSLENEQHPEEEWLLELLSAIFEYIITLKWGKDFGLALVWCCFLGDRMCQLIFINLTQTLVYPGRGTSREKATPPDGLQVNLQGIFLIRDLCRHLHSSTHTHCRHTSLCMIIMKINLFNNRFF